MGIDEHVGRVQHHRPWVNRPIFSHRPGCHISSTLLHAWPHCALGGGTCDPMCSCAFASIRPTPPQSGGVTRSNVPTQCADLWDPVVDGGRSYLGTGLRPCEPIVVFRTTIGAQHGLSGGLRPQWWTRFIKGCIAPVMVADGPARPPRAVESPALTSSASVVAACCDVESSIANKIQRPEGALHVICHVESSVTKIEHSAESRSHPHKSTDASTATIHANTANNNDPAPFSISPLLMPTAGFHGGRRNHHLGSSAGSHHGVLNRPSDAQAGEVPVLHVANHHSTTTTTSTPSMAHKPTTTSQPPGLLFKLSLLLPASLCSFSTAFSSIISAAVTSIIYVAI